MTQSWPQTSCVHVALASLPMSDAIARHQNRLPGSAPPPPAPHP